MLFALTLSILTGVAWIAVGVVFSLSVKKNIDFAGFMLVQNALCALGASLLIPDVPALLNGNLPRSLELAVVMGTTALLGGGGFLFMRFAMETGRHGVVWMISQSSMVIPFATGVVLWQEKASAGKLFGLAFLGASLLLCLPKGRGSVEMAGGRQGAWRWIAFAFVAFALIGASQSFSLIPSHWTGWTDKSHLRLPLLFGSSTLLWGCVALARRKPLDLKRTIAAAAPYSLFVLIGQELLYKSLDVATVAGISCAIYPLAIGVCVSGFYLYSALFLKERLTGSGIAGIACSVTGIALIACK